MVPSDWQQLCFLFTVPCANCTSGCCTCCVEAPSAEEGQSRKKQSKWSNFEGNCKKCQKEYKEKVAKINNLPQEKLLGAGSILSRNLFKVLQKDIRKELTNRWGNVLYTRSSFAGLNHFLMRQIFHDNISVVTFWYFRRLVMNLQSN